jgi:GDPmannose 4,6-dehydratase
MPVSEYAESKVEAHKFMQQARKEGIFAACGILYNHESSRRPVDFVTRKITNGVARISRGENLVLKLGNLNAVKDWGFAGDYVEAMWLVLQHSVPDDFVIGTGERHTVRDFVNEAFDVVGKKVEWRDSGVDEKGYVNGRLVIEVDAEFFRPVETTPSVADASKAHKLLGWKPEVSFKQLVKMMVDADLKH